MDKFIGKRLDARYEIREIIGVGGMAVVYKAYDCIDDRIVAIKILKEEFVRNSEFLNRFRNESKAIAVLSHPNIVKVTDVSFGDNFQYIVMEYIDGITLKEYIERTGALPWKNALYFTVQTLHALQHAHDKSIVHRDVKPQNIMLLRDGTIKVTDFGIARFSRSEQRTLTDKAIGSVHYISPEQARGDVTDEKADLYSVGVMLYEMLTGTLPFDGESAVSVALMHMQNEVKPPREINPSIPVGLEQIVMRAMQKNPNRRYHSDAEMLRDLEEIKRDPSAKFFYDESYSVDRSPTKYIGAIGNEGRMSEQAAADKIDDLYGRPVDKKPEYEVISRKKAAPQEKQSALLPTLAAIAIVVVIALVAFGGWFLVQYFDTGDAGQVRCPNLVGQDYEAAREKNNSIEIVIEKWVLSKEFSYGQIISQNPAEGKVLKEGSKVSVVVSSGKEAILMPDLQGYTLDGAKAKLAEKQYAEVYVEENIEVKEEYHNSIAVGEIIKTEPAGNAELTKDTKIIFVISKGPEPNMVSMPSVVGKSQNAATKKLEAAGLRVKVVESDSVIAKGIVLSARADGEIVNENDKIAYGTTVEITVSTGKAPVEEKTYSVTINVTRPTDYPTDTYTVKAVYGSQTKSDSVLKDIYEFTFEVTVKSGTIKVYIADDLYQKWEFNVKNDKVSVSCVQQESFANESN